MSGKKKVADTKENKRHSRNCTVKKGPGQYEEPDVVSSSEDEQGEKISNDNKDNNMRLISAVRKRQPLWDNRLTKVDRSQVIMNTLWIDVDTELGAQPGKSKTTWSTIRHKFSAERRRVEDGIPTNWQYYPHLSFLIATRPPKQTNLTSPHSSTQIVGDPTLTSPKKKKAAKNRHVIEERTQIVPVPIQRDAFKTREPLFMGGTNSMSDRMKRELSIESSDSEVDVVEEINMRNGSLMRHMENPMPYKRVCIRQMQETQVQNLDDDDEDDEIKRFCSYLEVMLRKMPKMNQELFCEETLGHLAAINRKLRRSNY